MAMNVESADECRICFQSGLYDIFNDELCLEEKSTKIKIYIVLNNFLFEKLYAQDEYSSLICQECCDNLCDSYTFMMTVRKAEQFLKLGIRPPPKASLSVDIIPNVELEEMKDPEACEDGIKIEIKDVEDGFQEVDEDSEGHELEEPAEELFTVTTFEQEPPLKRQRSASSNVVIPDSIVFTRYELQQENDPLQEDPNIVVLSVAPFVQSRPESGNYQFNSTWIKSNKHTAANTIFKCKHCVKAFASADFLLRHTLSSHLCLICLETVENYKELNKHSKQHSEIVCHFCQKNCGSSSNFRQHLKKQHMLHIPNHIGIVAETLVQ